MTLKVSGLSKEYKKKRALDNVTLSSPQESVGF